MSDATQIIRHGPLGVRAKGLPLFIATNMSGAAPYFTASLESAIQAGAASAYEFEPMVERLPTGSRGSHRPFPRAVLLSEHAAEVSEQPNPGAVALRGAALTD